MLTLTGRDAGSLSFEELVKALHKGGTADFGKGNTVGYAAKDKSGHLAPWAFDRRDVGEEDICIQIAYSGICHSDVHQIRNEWGNTQFPCNPGCALQAHPHIATQPSHNIALRSTGSSAKNLRGPRRVRTRMLQVSSGKA